MSTDLTFASQNLPSYLNGADLAGFNDGLTAHATLSFPVLSINGKRFTIVRGEDKQTIMNPLDPNSTAQYIDVVLVRVPKFTAKAYYSGNYNPDDEEAKKPICFSSTGIIPDEGATAPQCSSCKLCPKNAWGSGVDASGKPNKGKACRDAVRVALAPAGGPYTETMLLRIPPTSIKSLGEYGAQLTKRNIPYTAVKTRISFDPNETAQKLVFTPIGFLSQEAFAAVTEERNSDTTIAITGETPEVLGRIQAAQETAEQNTNTKPVAPKPEPVISTVKPAVEQAVATGFVTAAAVKETIEQKAEAKVAPKPTVTTSDEVGLDSLSFDN